MESTMISIESDGLIVDIPKTVVLGFLNFVNVQPLLKKIMTLESYDLMLNSPLDPNSKYDNYSQLYQNDNISSSYAGTKIYFKTFQPENISPDVFKRYKKERKSGESIEYFLIKHFETTKFAEKEPELIEQVPELTEEAPKFTQDPDYIQEEAPEFTYEAPQFIDQAPQYIYNAPQYGYEAQQYTYESPPYSDDGQYTDDGQQYANQAPQYINEAPQYINEAQQYAYNALEYAYDVQKYNNGLQYAYDGPQYANGAPQFAYEAQQYTQEAQQYTNEVPQYYSDDDVPEYVYKNNYQPINHQNDNVIQVEQPFVECYNGSANVRIEKKPLAQMDDAEIDALFAKPPWMRYK